MNENLNSSDRIVSGPPVLAFVYKELSIMGRKQKYLNPHRIFVVWDRAVMLHMENLRSAKNTEEMRKVVFSFALCALLVFLLLPRTMFNTTADLLGLVNNKRRRGSSPRGFLTLLELFSRIIPSKVRAQAFEPAYNDEKASYLLDRRHYKSGAARKWLAFCFGVHVMVIIAQCLWGMCSDKAKRLALESLPAIFRNHFGS